MKAIITFSQKTVLLLLTLFLCTGIWAQVAPPSDLNGESLKEWLRQNYYEGKHNQLGYSTARQKMYNYIDNKNNTITGVYSGYEVSWTYGGTGTNPSPINCEHTVPQSFFNEAEPMKSDIHHLFPTYQNWNSTRSNYPLKDIDDNSTTKWMYLSSSQASIPSTNIDAYSEYASSTFEPREDHKGNCARAIFYFYTMYPTQAGDLSKVGDLDVFYQWHLADPVDADELQRNVDVETYQGNRNPYIDYPELVARAYGLSGGSTVPSTPVISISSATSSITISWSDLSNETGYYIYKSSNGSSYTQLSTLAENAINYQDNDVVDGTTYYYYVVAFNAEGNGLSSNIVNGTLQSGGGSGSSNELLISEYIEGTSFNKAIEIANFTSGSINLANYSLKLASNGGGWGNELTLSGSLAAGEVYVVAHSSASATIHAQADLTNSSVINFNGNDAVGLFKSGVLIDAVGSESSSATFAQNVTLVRKSTVVAPNSTYTESEWDQYSENDFNYLGSHTMDITTDISTSEILYTGFESGWDIWTDGGGDCRLYSSGTYATEGSNAANIQDNSGVASSFYLTQGIDLQSLGYSSITLEFSFIPVSMENGERFYVEYYDGSSWNIVAEYIRGTDFSNNNAYVATIEISSSDYHFPSDMNVRFRCDASGNKDDIYIDEIRMTGSNGTLKGGSSNEGLTRLSKVVQPTLDELELTLNVFPIPATDMLTIQLNDEEKLGEINISIFDLNGEVLHAESSEVNDSAGEFVINVSNFNSGVYLVQIRTNKINMTRKLLVK